MCYYRPQTKFAKVMFLQVSVCPRGGGHAWQGGRAWGACMVGGGGMCGRGACMAGWACVVGGGRAWQILRDTVNERAVRILLECILVFICGHLPSSLSEPLPNGLKSSSGSSDDSSDSDRLSSLSDEDEESSDGPLLSLSLSLLESLDESSPPSSLALFGLLNRTAA